MSNIKQYMAWAEKRIATLVVQAGLHVGLLGVTQGPLTITYRVRLLHPSREALTKLLGMGDTFAEALHVEAVRVSRSQAGILLEVPSPIYKTPSASYLLTHAKGLAVCIGLTALRQPVRIDLRQHGAVFWVGPSRRGKTQSMKTTLFCLARQHAARLKFVILCHERKRDDWQAFHQAAGCMGIVTNGEEQVQVLTWAAGQLLTLRTPFVFVIVVDDLLNLLQKAPGLADPLAEIASLGAGIGVHLLAGTQEAGSKRGTGGEGVEANATAKVLYKPTSKARGARNAGQSEVDLASLTGAKGDAVLLIDGQATRIATGFADDRDIYQLSGGAQWAQPWRAQQHSTDSTDDQAQMSTNTDYVPVSLSGTSPVSAPVISHVGAEHDPTGGSVEEGGRTTGTGSMTSTAADDVPNVLGDRKLENREPTIDEQQYLRDLYRLHGSKNKVLRIAWGGVVNEDGKTPKTWKWLAQALELREGTPTTRVTEQRRSVVFFSPGRAVIDMNTVEGMAQVQQMVDDGLLPRDDLSFVTSYRHEQEMNGRKEG